MIAFVKGIDNDELEKHLGLVRHVVNQHRHHPAMPRLGRDEADSICRLALVEAAQDYDPNERPDSTFAGWACFVMRRRLRKALAKQGRELPTEDADVFDDEPLAQEHAADNEDRQRLVAAWKQLDLRDKVLISEHFGMGLCNGLSLEALAEPYGITKSAMSRRVSAAVARLKRLVEGP